MSTYQQYVRVLSVAGSDSGGGAGIQADLKTISSLGCFGMTAITAITAQNTQGVSDIHAIPPAILRAQMDAVLSDMGADAIKIGMLHDVDTVMTVAACLQRYAVKSVVLDPVMVATSGAVLIQSTAIEALVTQLFPLASVVTPNLDEAALLVGQDITDANDLLPAGERLLGMGANAVLIKGGHLPGDRVSDLLVRVNQDPVWWHGDRIETANTHGTGCTLSSAIAAFMAQGVDLVTAVGNARDVIRQALRAGAGVTTGRGSGPLNHFAAPVAMQINTINK